MRYKTERMFLLLFAASICMITGCSGEGESTSSDISGAKDAIHDFFIYSGESESQVPESQESKAQESEAQKSETESTIKDTSEDSTAVQDENKASNLYGEKLLGNCVLRVSYTGNAAYNVELACKYNESIVVQPGETYDAFHILGDGGEDMGFREAEGLLSDGSRVSMYGSGICPVTTAIYQAGRDAGLEIVEANDHVGADSAYADAGDQAMFNYPTSNLVMKNVFAYPITLYVVYREDAIYAQWYGTP